MKRYVLVIALMLLLVSPVYAWAEVSSITVGNDGHKGGLGNYEITIKNGTYWPVVTKISYDGMMYIVDNIPTDTFLLMSGTDVCGQYTLTTNDYELNNYSASVTFDIVQDWWVGGGTCAGAGENTLVIDTTNQSDSLFHHVQGFDGDVATGYNDYTVYARNEFSGPSVAPVGTWKTYTGSEINTPVASFACVPTSQFPNADVICTDTSANSPTDWYWSIDAEAMGIDGWQTATSRNFTWQSAYAGFYSVNLRANNSAGSDWENKTNYVSISGNATPNNCNLPVASGYVRTVFECLNSQDSSAVSGCDIQLRDNEAGSWSNATNRPDGLWCIDTYPEHTINGYAQASGYTSASSLNLHALSLSEGMYYLLLIPGYVPAAPDGKVYLYVTVNDYDNSQMIPSAYVTASWSGGGYAAATTSAAGTAILTVKNSTSIYITATKSGYVSVNRVISTTPFGPDSTTIGLHRMVVSPTATATTGPGGTVAPTVNPYGTTLPSGVMPAGYTNNQGQIMMDFLAANSLQLVELCFFVTICALLGFKFGK